jgi:hypothetical protein
MNETVRDAEKDLEMKINELQMCDQEMRKAEDRLAFLWKRRSALLGQFAEARRKVITERDRRDEYIASIERQAEFHERSVGTIPIDECLAPLTPQKPIVPCAG